MLANEQVDPNERILDIHVAKGGLSERCWMHPLSSRLRRRGFQPLIGIYFGSICLVFIVLINWRYYKKWDKLDDSQRGVLKALLFATSIAVVGSILRLVGAI